MNRDGKELKIWGLCSVRVLAHFLLSGSSLVQFLVKPAVHSEMLNLANFSEVAK